MLRKFLFSTLAVLCILVGLYAFSYFFVSHQEGILATKSVVLRDNAIWKISFYSHVLFGGIALLIGWIQFNQQLREKRIKVHRFIGRIYLIAVLISGATAIYIGYYATAGPIAALGFISLGTVWLYTTLRSYFFIKKKEVLAHQQMMYYSYAACCAAVSLRIWLPLLSIAIGDFFIAYQIAAWCCWIPNLVVAYFLLKSDQDPHLVF